MVNIARYLHRDMITEVRVNKKDALEAERHHSSVSEFITHWMEKSASQAEKDEVGALPSFICWQGQAWHMHHYYCAC